MKRFPSMLSLLMALLLFCLPASADDAGVLTETELNAWLNVLLQRSLTEEPLNAPIGEESLTEDGYAYLYSFATFYYDKPTLDAASKLNAIVVTDEALDTPRGIRLGGDVSMLMSAYGWENPTLAGDDSFARLYVLNQLPESAYWAWAQRDGSAVSSVRCSIHAQTSATGYTDAGILYSVQNGVISDIRVFGLNDIVSRSDVESNLLAVGGTLEPTALGITVLSDAEPFGAADLRFSGMDLLTLTENGASVAFGAPVSESSAQEDGGDTLHTLVYDGMTLMFSSNGTASRAESLDVTSESLVGPRGVMVGATLSDVLTLFRCDGSNAVSGGLAMVYGDGSTLPYATLEREAYDATLCYAASVKGTDGVERSMLYRLSFTNDRLTEWSIYTF